MCLRLLCAHMCEYHMAGNAVLSRLWVLTGGWSLIILVTEAWPTDCRPHTLHRTRSDLSHVRLLASVHTHIHTKKSYMRLLEQWLISNIAWVFIQDQMEKWLFQILNTPGVFACACTHVRTQKQAVCNIWFGLSSELSHHDHNSLVIDRSSLTH